MEILVHQFDELLCCFRKKLEKLVLVLSNEQCLSYKAVIQTNNEPYVIFRYLLNIWMCLCSVSSSDFWNYEIRFVIINTILVWSSLMSLSELLSLGFNNNYIIIIELKLRSFQNLSGIIEKQSTSLYRKN